MEHLRTIKSYVCRNRKMTAEQHLEWNELWRDYGEAPTGQLDFPRLFGNSKSIALEIGFGMGHSLLAQLSQQPGVNFLGIEVHRAGIYRLLHHAARSNLRNLKVLQMDAVVALEKHIPVQSLAAIQIYFPDPWPKRKHHKRRLLNNSFVALLCAALIPGGSIHIVTDWQEYAEQILQILQAHSGLQNCAANGEFMPCDLSRSVSKYQRRGTSRGLTVWEMKFIKILQK